MLLTLMFLIAAAGMLEASDKSDWRQALKGDSIESYKQYLQARPRGKWASEAHEKIVRLNFTYAKFQNSREAYEYFLSRFGEHQLAAVARVYLENLLAKEVTSSEWNKALESDTIDAFQSIISRYPETQYAEQAKERIERLKLQPFMAALRRGDVSEVRHQVERGADVNTRLLDRLPLDVAIDSGSEELISALLSYGAQPSGEMLLSVVRSDSSALKKLLAISGSTSVKDSMLRMAASGRDIDLVEVLSAQRVGHRSSGNVLIFAPDGGVTKVSAESLETQRDQACEAAARERHRLTENTEFRFTIFDRGQEIQFPSGRTVFTIQPSDIQPLFKVYYLTEVARLSDTQRILGYCAFPLMEPDPTKALTSSVEECPPANDSRCLPPPSR